MLLLSLLPLLGGRGGWGGRKNIEDTLKLLNIGKCERIKAKSRC